MLTAEHAAYLARLAVTPEAAQAAGIYSITETKDLPEGFTHYGEAAVPAIVFPWQEPDGRKVLQLKPDVEVLVEGDPEPRKYLWRKGEAAQLGVFRARSTSAALIVEGTKQALVAATYAPDDMAVYGIAGHSSWMSEGVPTPHLAVVDGLDVLIALDSDAATNRAVYEGGMKLAEAALAEGAKSVKFVRIPGGKKAALDDVLGARSEDRRSGYLARLLGSTATKPASTKPPPTKQKSSPRPEADDGRPLVDVSGDRWALINRITSILTNQWDGTRLFNYGSTISERRGHELRPLDQERGFFNNIVAESMRTGSAGSQGDWSDYWPDTWTRDAVLSRHENFSPLLGIARMPFVRLDGTICATPGYDPDSQTFVVLDPELVDLPIPAYPTKADVAAARKLLMEEWLGDMPFPDEASRANALGLVLTPFIRGLVPIVPLAVLDGLQASVGKNLLADCLCILATGYEAKPLPWAGDEEEQRKALTSAFMTGADIFVFDEAHIIHGRALAQVLTAATWQDRILGASKMGDWPNHITWVSLGNQVQLQGDLFRRVYRIRLHPTGANPENRPDTDFRHPDLRGWTHENRPALLTAALTLVQAWQVAGKPRPTAAVNFGSFEEWQKVVGGIIEFAGQEDFLANTTTWRSESDHDRKQWLLHLAWLHDTFGDTEFTSREAREKMVLDPESNEPPIDGEPVIRGYSQKLGKAYFTVSDRWIDGYQLLRKEFAHASVRKWQVIKADGGPPPEPEPPKPERLPPTYPLFAVEPEVYSDSWDCAERPITPPTVGTLVFDIETADAHELWRYEDEHEGEKFVRLIGYQVDGGEVTTTKDPGEIVLKINEAAQSAGHNIMAFDILALAKYEGLDIKAVHQLTRDKRVVDTKLVAFLDNPPTERKKSGQIEKEYSLQAQTGAKTGDLKALAKKHGGFDQIPLDDPEFVEYLEGDVRAAALLLDRLAANPGELDPYVWREHQVAALAAQITFNGFRVDVPLLHERIAAGQKRKQAGLAQLIMQYDLPTTNKSGQLSKSPQATEAGKEAIRQAFQDLGIQLPRTPTEAPALGREALDSVIENNPNHPEVIELAELVKGLNGERTVYQTVDHYRFGDRVHPQIDMRQTSGRWSITKPGLTVMGKRGGKHIEREVFLPEPGHVIIAVDLAQVDARAIAVHCQDPAYIALFEEGRDLHAEIAERVWGDAGRREDAKAIGHGWNYGMGPRGLARTAGVPLKEAEHFDSAMVVAFPKLVAWRDDVRRRASEGQMLDNGWGRKMRPNPDRSWTQGPALIGQGCARDLMMEGLLRLPDELLPALRAVVHDEVVLSVPKPDAREMAEVVIAALTFDWAPPGKELQVPIVAGLAGPPAPNWGAVYEKESK